MLKYSGSVLLDFKRCQTLNYPDRDAIDSSMKDCVVPAKRPPRLPLETFALIVGILAAICSVAEFLINHVSIH
jgi:hypothetical protein